MLRLSIIIPCLQPDERFDETLASILQNRPPQCEVLVVYRGSYDDPYDLKDEVRFIDQPEDASLVELATAGIASARAEIVHFVACGLQVDEGWTESPLTRFEQRGVGSVVPLLLPSDDGIEAISGVSLSNRDTRHIVMRRMESKKVAEDPLGPALEAAFYRLSALKEVDGPATVVGDELADVDLALQLRQAGYSSVVDPRSRLTGEPPPLPQISAFRRGQFAERFYRRHNGNSSLAVALLLRPWSLSFEFATTIPRGGAFGKLLGRISVWGEAALSEEATVDEIADRQTKSASLQLRVDSAHGDRNWSQRNANKPAS